MFSVSLPKDSLYVSNISFLHRLLSINSCILKQMAQHKLPTQHHSNSWGQIIYILYIYSPLLHLLTVFINFPIPRAIIQLYAYNMFDVYATSYHFYVTSFLSQMASDLVINLHNLILLNVSALRPSTL